MTQFIWNSEDDFFRFCKQHRPTHERCRLWRDVTAMTSCVVITSRGWSAIQWTIIRYRGRVRPSSTQRLMRTIHHSRPASVQHLIYYRCARLPIFWHASRLHRSPPPPDHLCISYTRQTIANHLIILRFEAEFSSPARSWNCMMERQDPHGTNICRSRCAEVQNYLTSNFERLNEGTRTLLKHILMTRTLSGCDKCLSTCTVNTHASIRMERTMYWISLYGLCNIVQG